MSFIGALLWALGDPDKNRKLNVLHPLSVTVGGLSDRLQMYRLCIIFMIFGALYLVEQYSDYFSKSVTIICLSVLLCSGFLRVCVSAILINKNIKVRVLREGLILMVLSGLYLVVF